MKITETAKMLQNSYVSVKIILQTGKVWYNNPIALLSYSKDKSLRVRV